MKPADDPSPLWPGIRSFARSKTEPAQIANANTLVAPDQLTTLAAAVAPTIASTPPTIAEPIILAIRIAELRRQ